jgi:hypothetical protein
MVWEFWLHTKLSSDFTENVRQLGLGSGREKKRMIFLCASKSSLPFLQKQLRSARMNA